MKSFFIFHILYTYIYFTNTNNHCSSFQPVNCPVLFPPDGSSSFHNQPLRLYRRMHLAHWSRPAGSQRCLGWIVFSEAVSYSFWRPVVIVDMASDFIAAVVFCFILLLSLVMYSVCVCCWLVEIVLGCWLSLSLKTACFLSFLRNVGRSYSYCHIWQFHAWDSLAPQLALIDAFRWFYSYGTSWCSRWLLIAVSSSEVTLFQPCSFSYCRSPCRNRGRIALGFHCSAIFYPLRELMWVCFSEQFRCLLWVSCFRMPRYSFSSNSPRTSYSWKLTSYTFHPVCEYLLPQWSNCWYFDGWFCHNWTNIAALRWNGCVFRPGRLELLLRLRFSISVSGRAWCSAKDGHHTTSFLQKQEEQNHKRNLPEILDLDRHLLTYLQEESADSFYHSVQSHPEELALPPATASILSEELSQGARTLHRLSQHRHLRI